MGIQSLFVSYERARRAEGLSPYTLRLYRDCHRRLLRFIEAEAGSDDLANFSHRLLTDYFAVRLETCAPATVWTDWKCARRYARWLFEEGEVSVDPTARIRAPRQSSKPVPVLSEAELKRLVLACDGPSRRDKRDSAAMRLLIEGLRRGEVCGMSIADVDLDHGLVTITGKGKTRTIVIGSKTVVALDRWMRVNADNRANSLFGLTPSGLYQALKTRADLVGIPNWFPHRMRHTAAHRWLLARGGESDLMEVMGWSSPSMLRRYGVSAAAERARAAQRSLALSDAV